MLGAKQGWLTAKPKKFDTSNQVMQDLLSCRMAGDGEPIIIVDLVKDGKVINTMSITHDEMLESV